jgi:putative ABC transport system permease protein
MSQDLRYAIRTLWKSPGFTIVALLTLALGIGATSAIFTIVNSVLLRPLPFQDPTRLYLITPTGRFGGIPDPDFLTYQTQAGTLEQIAGFAGGRMTMLGAGEPISISTKLVTSSFWPTLGVQPSLGRVFRADERNGLVLSDHLWRSHFNADPSVLGKTVQLDGESFTIVGVMSGGFNFPAGAELWMPFAPDPANHHNASLQVIGRLRPGATPHQADAELAAISTRFDWGPRPRSVRLISLHESIVGNVKKSLAVFLGAVGFLLLIACVNVANLLVARGARRTEEFATRAALGATRWRLVRQLVTESLLLSVAGGVAGLLIAAWGESALISIAPAGLLPRLPEVRIDAWVLGFTTVVSLITGVLFGLLPAMQISRSELNESIKRSATRLSGANVRGALVIAEIALALVLLAGAGLLIRSFVRLRSVPTGFESQNVLSMAVTLSPDVYRTQQQLRAFHSELLSRIVPLPGVVAVGAVNWLPFGGNLIRGDAYAENRPDSTTHFSVTKPGVSEDYFRAMGIHLLRGRFFTAQDIEHSPSVAIIGQAAANTGWPGQDPIGKRITLEDNPKPEDWLTVVGIVDDVKQQKLAEKAPPAVYQPLTQVKRAFFLGNINYVVRTNGDERKLAALLRARLREIDPNQPIQTIATMDDLLNTSIAEPQFQIRIMGTFAAVSLLLAMVGIYGVMAYAVAGRTREIGIRVALGATGRDVLRHILSRSVMLIAAGLALGFAGTLATTRVLRDFLFEVTPTDPITLSAVVALLATVALAAAYLPARAAMKVDPVTALRHE